MGMPTDSGNNAKQRRSRSRPARVLTAEESLLGKALPHSLEAEQALLGSLLLAGGHGISICREIFRTATDVFYDPRHQILFNVIEKLVEENIPVDLTTVGQRLKDEQLFDTIGGYPFLANLAEAVPSAANLEYYARLVHEKYLLRRLIQTSEQILERAFEDQHEVREILDFAEREILAVRGEQFGSSAGEVSQWLDDAIQKIHQLFENRGRPDGIPTGFPDLDRMINGMHPGEMIVIAARPSMGKTSLAMNIAENVAVRQGRPVAVFSLEMTAPQLTLRLLCSMARLDLRRIRDGLMNDDDFRRLHQASVDLAKAPLYIDDTPGLTIGELRARARRLRFEKKVELIVVDYLQLLRVPQRRGEINRQQEIAEISSGVKSLAKELQVPVVVLSQLNRDLERDRTRKPRLSDLRESGAIEQDADVVGLLYRADPNDPRKPASADEDEEIQTAEIVPINLLIAKQRNGPVGDIYLIFQRTTTRFESRAIHEAEALAEEKVV